MAITTTSTTNPVTTTSTTVPVTTTSVTQPATTTSTTTSVVDPVAVALNKLSKTAIQNLWDDKITNRGFFGRIPGIFEYFFGSFSAFAQDTKEATASIEKFNKATAELVQAVAVRFLTPEEAVKVGVGKAKLTGSAQIIHAQQKLDAEAKLAAFYAVFKERVSATQLNIAENSDQFGAFAAGAEMAVKEAAKNVKGNKTPDALGKEVDVSATLAPKVETTLTQFKTKIFDDMVNSYAEQSIENITIESFKQKVTLIKGYFAKNDSLEIQAKLRQAIKANHDSQELSDLKAEIIGAAANTGSDRYVAAKEARKTTLEAEQTALRTELDAFRGTNGFNGSLHAADEAQKQAEAAVTQKYIELVAAFQQPVNGLNQNDRDATIARIIAFLGAGAATTTSSSTANVARVTALLGEYQEKIRTLDEKKAAREALQKRFDEVAVYTGTNLTGGLLAEADAGLDDATLNTETAKELRNLAGFYGALNKEINDGNKTIEAQRLNFLIGG